MFANQESGTYKEKYKNKEHTPYLSLSVHSDLAESTFLTKLST